MNLWRTLVASLVVMGVALLSGWTRPFHLAVGGTALVLVLGISATFLWWRSRQEVGDVGVAEPEEGGDTLLRATVLAALAGLVVCVCLGGAIEVASRFDPLVGWFTDGDRPAFEARLAPLVQAGQHEQAGNLIRARLQEGRMSRAWKADLTQRLGEADLEAACLAPDAAERLSRLEAVVKSAETHGLDGRRAMALLERERERQTARAALGRLRVDRHWPQLVASLDFFMASRDRDQWEVPADRWLLEALLEWAKDCTNLVVRREKLTMAIDAATRHGLDPSPAKALLDAAERETSLAADIQRARKEEKEAARSQFDQLREEQLAVEEARKRELAAAADELKRQESDAVVRLARATREERFGALIDAADRLPGPVSRSVLEQRIALYAQARDFAVESGIDPQKAVDRLTTTQGELTAMLAQLQRESLPADLPAGALARIVSVRTDRFPPSLDLELAVEDAQKHPIRSLQRKDFRVWWNGAALDHFALAPVQSQPPPLHVVVAVDHSGSMAGPSLAAALAAAKDMIRALASEPSVRVQVLAFSDRVQVRCPWTRDVERAASSLEGLARQDQTALFGAVETALKELANCPAGDRRLVLFTDGKDTQAKAGFDLADLTRKLHAAAIPVLAIGLQTKELDRTTLGRLAAETGGTYYHATAPGEIASRFVEARRGLRREFYRFVLTPDSTSAPARSDLRIEVGGANQVVASTNVPMPQGPFAVNP